MAHRYIGFIKILFGFLFCVPVILCAQTYDAGGLLGMEYGKKIGKGFHFGAIAELRLNEYYTNFDRMKVGGEFDYTFFKKRFKIRIGAHYLLTDQENYYENRGRVYASFTYTEKIKRFKLSFRVRPQATFYETTYGNHKVNPKTYLRNRLQLTYSFFSKPVKLYVSTEFFLRLYQKKNYFIDNFRTLVGAEYQFNDRSSLNMFFRVDNEIQVKNPANVFYVGVFYNFSH